jgi:hypothetical protein
LNWRLIQGIVNKPLRVKWTFFENLKPATSQIEKAKPNAHHGGAETRRKEEIPRRGSFGCGELRAIID